MLLSELVHVERSRAINCPNLDPLSRAAAAGVVWPPAAQPCFTMRAAAARTAGRGLCPGHGRVSCPHARLDRSPRLKHIHNGPDPCERKMVSCESAGDARTN